MTDGKNSLRISSWGGGVKAGYLCLLEHWENVILTDFRAPHIPVLCPEGQRAHPYLYSSPLSPAGFLSLRPSLFHPLLSAQHPASPLTEQGSVSKQKGHKHFPQARDWANQGPRDRSEPPKGCCSLSLERSLPGEGPGRL